MVDQNWLYTGALVCLSIGLIYLGPTIGKWVFFRKSFRELEWWEIARRTYPISFYHLYYTLILVVAAVTSLHIQQLGPPLPLWSFLIIILICLSISEARCRAISIDVLKKLDRGKELSTTRKSKKLIGHFFQSVIFKSTLYLFLLGAFIVPDYFAKETWIISGSILLFALIWNWWLSIWFLKITRIIVPATPELQQLALSETVQLTQSNPPKVWELRTEMYNAFAFPIHHAIGFTQPVIELLNDREIRAISRHELAHLCESPAAHWTRRLAIVAYAPLLFIRPLSADGTLMAFVPVLVTYFLHRSFLRFSQSMEHRADSKAIEDHDETEANLDYGRALEKIYEANLIPAVLPGNNSHPDLYDRLISLGIEPDYPRPKPPRQILALLVASTYVLASITLIGFLASKLINFWA